jgi:hypothetical protein
MTKLVEIVVAFLTIAVTLAPTTFFQLVSELICDTRVVCQGALLRLFVACMVNLICACCRQRCWR